MGVLRVGAFFVSSFLWLLSVLWSADGFGIKMEGWEVAGYGLAICVTIVQLVFNRGTMNPTLYFGGLAAYLYGVSTNVIGLIHITATDLASFGDDPIDSMLSVGLIVALAFVVEVLPESLLLWSINPEKGSPGDFISSFVSGSGLNGKNTHKKMPPKEFVREQTFTPNRTNESNYQRTNNRTNERKPFPYRINWREIDRNTQVFDILSFAKEYWNKHGKDCPNKILVTNKIAKSAQVSEVLGKMKRGEYA